MSDVSGPPFRADHVGSLLRPPELLRARAEHQGGRLSAEKLRRAEDEAIRDVVRMQQEIGLQGVTDGEFRRGSWHMDFLYRIGGVAKTDQTLRIQFRNEAGPVGPAPGKYVVERIRPLPGFEDFQAVGLRVCDGLCHVWFLPQCVLDPQ